MGLVVESRWIDGAIRISLERMFRAPDARQTGSRFAVSIFRVS